MTNEQEKKTLRFSSLIGKIQLYKKSFREKSNELKVFSSMKEKKAPVFCNFLSWSCWLQTRNVCSDIGEWMAIVGVPLACCFLFSAFLCLFLAFPLPLFFLLSVQSVRRFLVTKTPHSSFVPLFVSAKFKRILPWQYAHFEPVTISGSYPLISSNQRTNEGLGLRFTCLVVRWTQVVRWHGRVLLLRSAITCDQALLSLPVREDWRGVCRYKFLSSPSRTGRNWVKVRRALHQFKFDLFDWQGSAQHFRGHISQNKSRKHFCRHVTFACNVRDQARIHNFPLSWKLGAHRAWGALAIDGFPAWINIGWEREEGKDGRKERLSL